MATICCWPPESEPASWRRRSRRIGKEPVHAVQGVLAGPARFPPVAAHLEILLHRHPREQPAPLGHQGDALAAHQVRWQGVEVDAVQAQLARAGAVQAGDGVHQRALAGAVGSDDGDDLAGGHLQRGVHTAGASP